MCACVCVRGAAQYILICALVRRPRRDAAVNAFPAGIFSPARRIYGTDGPSRFPGIRFVITCGKMSGINVTPLSRAREESPSFSTASTFPVRTLSRATLPIIRSLRWRIQPLSGESSRRSQIENILRKALNIPASNNCPNSRAPASFLAVSPTIRHGRTRL